MEGGGLLQIGKGVTHLHDLVGTHNIIVVRELQAGEHPLDEGGLAGSPRPDDTDEPVGVGEVFMSYLFAQEHQPLLPRGAKYWADTMYCCIKLRMLQH